MFASVRFAQTKNIFASLRFASLRNFLLTLDISIFLIQKTHLISSNFVFLDDFKKLFSGRKSRKIDLCSFDVTDPTRLEGWESKLVGSSVVGLMKYSVKFICLKLQHTPLQRFLHFQALFSNIFGILNYVGTEKTTKIDKIALVFRKKTGILLTLRQF